MDKLKLIIACAIVVGLSQLELDGAPQRKYYTGSKAIQARQEAAAAGQLSTSTGGGDQGGCSGAGGLCTRGPQTATKTAEQLAAEKAAQEEAARQQAAQEALQAQVAQQAEQLRLMQEQLNALKK